MKTEKTFFVFLYLSFVEHRNRGRYRVKNQGSTKWGGGAEAVSKNYFIKKVYDEKYLTHDIHIHKQ